MTLKYKLFNYKNKKFKAFLFITIYYFKKNNDFKILF